MDKSGLRSEMIGKRAAFAGSASDSANKKICSRVLSLEKVIAAKRIGAYLSFSGEADSWLLVESLLRDGKKVFVPVQVEGGLRFAEINSADKRLFARGKFGEPEPLEKNFVEPGSIDVFIVPGLAFDKKGFRVGWGKGLYDKFFRENRISAPKVGLAFSFQLVEGIPAQGFDVKMDFLVTEKKVFEF